MTRPGKLFGVPLQSVKRLCRKKTIGGWILFTLSVLLWISDKWDSIGSFYDKIRAIGPVLKFLVDTARTPAVQLAVFISGCVWIGIAMWLSPRSERTGSTEFVAGLRGLVPLFVITTCLLIIGYLVNRIETAHIPIYSLFTSVHESFGKELADPRKKEVLLERSYLGKYENATVIWFAGPTIYDGTLYVLATDKTWTAFSCPTWQNTRSSKEDRTWYSDECNRTRFGTPEWKLPPYGGIAWQWARDLQDGTHTQLHGSAEDSGTSNIAGMFTSKNLMVGL